MANKRANPRKTAGRLIVDTLKAEKAFNQSSAQPVTIFKDLPLSTTLIAYTIANLMQDDIIIQTNDKYYYSEENWRKFESKFNRVYWMLIIIPASMMIIFLLIQAFGRFF